MRRPRGTGTRRPKGQIAIEKAEKKRKADARGCYRRFFRETSEEEIIEEGPGRRG